MEKEAEKVESSELVQTITVLAYVDENRRLIVELPDDVPIGEVIITLKPTKMPSAAELLKMLPEESDRYLRAAAVALENEYRTNPELTATAETIDLMDYKDEDFDNQAR